MGWHLTFEVAFDIDASSQPDSGDWVDLTSRLAADVTVTWASLRDGDSQTTLTLDNADRELDPTNSASTFADGLVPMRHARLTVHDDDGQWSVPLFTGFVEGWPPSWSGIGTVQVVLVDAAAWLGLQEADVDEETVWPAELTGDRIARLLDLAGWPDNLRDLDRGQIRCTPVEGPAGSIRQLVLDVVDAEDGDLYISPDGVVVFRERHARLTADAPLTVGSDGYGVPASVDVEATEDVEPRSAADELFNVATVQLEDGHVYRHVDDDSVNAFGPREIVVRDVHLTELEARALAQWEVWRWASPREGWIDPLTLWPDGDDQLQQVLACVPGAAATLTVVHEVGADTVVDIWVDQAVHTIPQDGGLWTCAWSVSPRIVANWATLRPSDPPVNYGTAAAPDYGLLAP